MNFCTLLIIFWIFDLLILFPFPNTLVSVYLFIHTLHPIQFLNLYKLQLLFAKIFSRFVFYQELKNIQIWRCGKWTTPCVGVSYDFIVGGFLWSITRILNHLSLINLYYYPLILFLGTWLQQKIVYRVHLPCPKCPKKALKVAAEAYG